MQQATYRDGFTSGGHSAKVTLRPVSRAHTLTNPEENMIGTDSLGYTEREWENFQSAKSQNDGCQTAHCSSFDDESYCEGCDQTVDYSDGSKHGRCGC